MADTKLSALATELTAFTGDERIYLVDDDDGTPASVWARPAHFLPDGGRITHYDDATVYNVNFGITNGSVTGAVTASRLYMIPIFVRQRRAMTTLGAVVTIAGAGATTGRLGLYNSSATGHPTTLIQAGAATVAVDSTGVKTATITQTLNPGWYFLAFVTDGAPTMVGGNTANTYGGPLGAVLSGTTIQTVSAFWRAFAYAALPADETAQSYTLSVASVIPILGIR